MKDITRIQDGEDLEVVDTIAPKAANVLSIQLGALEYRPTFGVDLAFFLESPLEFQNESFKAYLIQRLTEESVNVSACIDTVNALFSTLSFKVGEINANAKGYIR